MSPSLLRTQRVAPLLVILTVLATVFVRADYKQAVALFSQGKYDRALEAIKPDVEANPNWEFGHRLMGLCYVQMGQNSLAVAALNKAVQLKSEAFPAYQGLAQAYFNLGKYANTQEILAAGEKYAKTGEDQYTLHFLRGSALLQLKNYPEAVSSLTGAVKLNSNSFLVYSQLGAAYLGQKSFAEAISSLEKALQMQPDHAATQGYLARAYELAGAESLKAKDYPAAVQRLVKARDLRPSNGSVLFNLGSAYLFQERYKEAEEALQKSSTLLADNPKVYERLGYLYEKTRVLDKALAAYQKAATLSPSAANQESVERIKKRMSQPT